MQPLSVPLCEYCRVAVARAADPYCCDGCRTLAGISGPSRTKSTPSLDLLEERRLTEHFGRTQGEVVSFECHVDALACEACLQGLARLENHVPGLGDLRWDRNRSVLSFSFPREQEQPGHLGRILESMSLNPRWLRAGEQPVQNRTAVLRLGLTGAFAANIMLFAVPIYTGVTGTLQTVFEWLQLLVFLPVVFWSAIPIYRTAWVSLRMRHLSVDLPLALAFILGSIFSFASLAQGGHDLYFDSLSGFLFLILWSRSLLEKSLSKALATPDLGQFFEKPLFDVRRNDTPERLPWDRIAVGDELILNAGDRLPADAMLLSPSAEVETAWMTGERTPRLRLHGALMQAGTRLLSNEARMRVVKIAEESDFAKLLKSIHVAGDKLGADLEGRLASGLVLINFAVIAGLFILAAPLGIDELLRRAIALLIVACPCAVSFAAPLARARANKIAFQKGFWVRDPRVWDRLLSVNRIAFDKTGTLTGGLMRLSSDSPLIDAHWKRVILSLENVSRHPIAESLRRLWGPHELFEVADAQEIPGVGVDGRIMGVQYQIRGGTDEGGRIRLDLLRENVRVVEIRLQDDHQARVSEALDTLKRGRELYLLSGDRSARVQAFAKVHGFTSENAYGDLDPARKAEVLRQIAPDVYVGDGTNDLPAMKAAPVAVAVKAAALEAQAAADLVMFNGELIRLEEIFALAKATRTLNRRNLIFALIYNVLAGIAAVSGWIHPLAAALLMPVSSLLLLASTTWGTTALRKLEGRS